MQAKEYGEDTVSLIKSIANLVHFHTWLGLELVHFHTWLGLESEPRMLLVICKKYV
jgi:hypothetical protein